MLVAYLFCADSQKCYACSMLFWGLTISFMGKASLALSVISVHKKITDEKRIDGIVLMEMRRERTLAIMGLLLMAVGYALELFHFNALPF